VGQSEMKKVYPIMVILIILLYTAIILYQKNIVPLGDVFGYLFYVIVAVGVGAAIWLLIKPPRKTNQ
jgi:hypothetical protein